MPLEPQQGRVDESARRLLEGERSIAEALAVQGHEVVALARSDGYRVKSPDALVDGIPTEFKTLAAAADSKRVLNRLNDAKKQARSVVLDARTSGLSKVEAGRGIRRALGAYPGHYDGITILGADYRLQWPEDFSDEP